MTFTVTKSDTFMPSHSENVTVCTYLKNFYHDLAPGKKITEIDHQNFENFLKSTKWNLNFTYSLYDLKNALTHSSFTHEWGEHYPSNEKLEFIGDSVLNLIVGQTLYQKFPTYNEGKLSKLRGALVNEEELSVIAKLLKLSDSLFLGKGEIKKTEISKSTLADAVEAILAVIYLNEGLSGAEKFLKKIFELYEAKFGVAFICEKRLIDFDPKSLLQERLQKLGDKIPDYRAMEISQGSFRVELWIGDDLCLVKSGNNKKTVEKELAKEYLQKILI